MIDQRTTFSVDPYILEIPLIEKIDDRLVDLFHIHLVTNVHTGYFHRNRFGEMVKSVELDLRDLLRQYQCTDKHPGEYDFS